MDLVSIKDFEKLDIRIGTVLKAEVPEWSHWVIKLTVDFVSEAKSTKNRSSRRVRTEPKSREGRSGGASEVGKRTVFSGIMKFYKPEDLVGKQFPFIVNLEPKKIGPEGDVSEGMMIMATPEASDPGGQATPEDDAPPVLFSLRKKVANGCRVR